MPFRCAVSGIRAPPAPLADYIIEITLPTSVTFSRASAIPYYVVFTTTPRSLTLAREIASDATISVTLVRKITVTEPSSPPPTPPQTPSTSDESDSTRGKLLKRVVRSRAGSISSWSPTLKTSPEEGFEKELPRLPMQAVFSESRPLHTSICIGFPKRPRHQAGPEKHPSLDSQAALPDGLHKARFVLSRNMLPSIDWSGVSVKCLGLRGRPEPRDSPSFLDRDARGRYWQLVGFGQALVLQLNLHAPLSSCQITRQHHGRRCKMEMCSIDDNNSTLLRQENYQTLEIILLQVAGMGDPLWDQGKIIRFGWTFDERLVVLNEEGTYRIYDLQGDYQQHSLGGEAAELGVVDAKIHESGLVALTGSLTLLEVKGWEGARPLTLANPGLSEPPSSWTIIPPDLNISRHIEVLLSVDSTIYTIDNLESIDQRLSQGPFTHISASPNGKSLALLTFSGTLLVVSSDFQRRMAEFNTLSVVLAEGPVQQVEWCGNDAILITWDSLAVLVGPFADTLESEDYVLAYSYIGHIYAVTEPDGVRVLGQDTCDLIQKVPSSSLSIFRPGSSSPAAILYDAWESFSRRSPKADESIRSIRPELAAAVDGCIDAAGQEWEPYWQRRLLNAAKFGRGFLDFYNPTDFVNMGQTLKVLNSVRYFEIGIPLTYAQYSYTSPSHLVSRLTARNMHLLALRISTFLSLKADVVLKHWASAKILRSKPTTTGSGKDAELGADEEVCKMIVDKFETLGGADVSYAEIAKRAWEVGRTGLATRLLDYEPKASDQVPLLLSMKEDRLALQKAVDSGDTDLIYQVLLHLHNHLTLGTFFRLIEDGGSRLAPASRLLQVYAREQNREMLRDFYYSDDRRVESAVLALDEASKMADPSSKISSVKSAQKFFSEDKDRGFEAKARDRAIMVDENVRLLSAQQQLEAEADGKVSFFGLSVNETIRLCILNGMSKRADKLKTDFKVPDKRYNTTPDWLLTGCSPRLPFSFWYIKLYALTEARDFGGLDAFAKSKRSPIGYEPFVRHLVEKKHTKEAIPFVAKCDPPKRADLYVLCDEWRLAGKECKDRGDKGRLQELIKKAPNSLVTRELEQVASTMK
ncbi:Vacuolar protein sorting-associated protein 16 [Marasmius crinis-equi]|uniref:Vacuolar protein sorting-associated protein 16 n=1 Tax=Marasmius crinis-equi TaxID=585013 RepID=A0ABR3FS03_9AGAR